MPTAPPLGAGLDWADPRSRLAPVYLTPGGVAAVGVLCFVTLVLATGPLWHTDFWSHLRSGEVMAATRALPDRDPLTPFATERPAASAWLSQLGYHGLMRLGGSLEGGVELVRLVHLLAAVAAIALVGLALRRAGATAGWAAAGMAGLAVLIPGSLAVQRPQLLALPLFAAVLAALSRPQPTRRAVVWVPLVVGLWANLHGSFPVGLAVVGLTLLGKLVNRDAPPARRLGWMSLLCVAAVCVNPVGPAVFPEVVRFAGNPNLRTLAEWQPLHFTAGPGGHRAYLLTVGLVATARVLTGRRFTAAEWLILVPFAAWPVLQQRAFVWWAPLAVWLAVPRLARRFPGREVPPDFRRTVLAVLLVVLTVVGSPAARWVTAGPRPLTAAVHDGTPFDLAAALTGGRPLDPGRAASLASARHSSGPVFASETLGDFLAWAAPGRPVLLTNHAQSFTPDHWRKCMAVKAAGPGWDDALRDWGVNVVAVEPDFHPDLVAALRRTPGWRVLLDETAAAGRDGSGRLVVAVRE